MNTRILPLRSAFLFLFSLLLTSGLFAQSEEKEETEMKHRPGQVTLVSPLGTNGLESGACINHFSLNIFSGYSGGTDGVEIGGFLNVNKQQMRGAQFGGFANIVGGEVKGAQFAGFLNIAADPITGGQFAGFCNLGDSLNGFQAAGFYNQTKGIRNGGQAAGFLNVNRSDADGFQIAGFHNLTKGNVKGLQIAGFANVATGDVTGGQIAGFFNKAKNVKGVQIGIINVADTVEGVSLGLISLVKNGYRRLEFSGSEVLWGNVSYKTGTKKLYNIYSLGATPTSEYLRWGLGIGLGTERQLGEKSSLNLEGMVYHINEGQWWTPELNLLTRFQVLFSRNLGEKTALFAGPSANLLITQLGQNDGKDYGEFFAPYLIWSNSSSYRTRTHFWIGGSAGIRF